MKVKYAMKEVWIGGGRADAPRCNIFLSDDFYTNRGRCIVLIQGIGSVRAGFWAKSVFTDDGLILGSVLPVLEFAKKTGQSVIVLNPNMAKDPFTGQNIRHCSTMNEHCKYVWANFLTKNKCKAETLAFIVHSAGGLCMAQLYKDYKTELLQRVRCLVFTDAYYHSMFTGLGANQVNALKSYAIHFKAYKKGQAHMDVGEEFER